MALPAFAPLRFFARDRRGSAAVEFAVGVAALLTISMLCFDLYSLVRVYRASAQSAVVMADYVSRETTPNWHQVSTLGEFLRHRVFGAPVHLVYVISAVGYPSGGDPVQVLWVDDTIRFGDAAVTSALAAECSRRGSQGWRAALLAGLGAFGMTEGEVVIVAEVCARPGREGMLTNRFVTGDIYRLHVRSSRAFEQTQSGPVSATTTEAASGMALLTKVGAASGQVGRS